MGLLLFNVSVEICQLTFIAAVLGAIAVARRIGRRLTIDAPSCWRHAPRCVIDGIAAFWVVQRVEAF